MAKRRKKKYRYLPLEERAAARKRDRELWIEQWHIKHEAEREKRRLKAKAKREKKKELYFERREKERIRRRDLRRAQRLREKQREREKARIKAARERERARRKKREAELREKQRKAAKRKKEAQRVKEHKKELAQKKRQRKHEYVLRHAKEKKSARNRRWYKKKMAPIKFAKLHREASMKYYYEKIYPERLKSRIEANDLPGTFVIAIANDGVVEYKKIFRHWRNDAFEKFEEMIESNHANAMCPKEYEKDGKPWTDTDSKKELLLLKHVNPEVEGNETSFPNDYGMNITVSTDDEEWAILRKEPWYVEEMFSVNDRPRAAEKHTAEWIGENLIEPKVSEYSLKRVIIWKKILIIDYDDDFDFVIGRSELATTNLYLSLFKRYEDLENVFFVGDLSQRYYTKWAGKIGERTGQKFVQNIKAYY